MSMSKMALPPSMTDPRNLAWLRSGGVVIVGGDYGDVWYHPPHNDEWKKLSIGQDPRCSATYYYDPLALPNGNLSIRQDCMGTWLDRPQGRQHQIISLYEYDLDTDEYRTLFHDLPRVGQVTWNPDMSRGIYATLDAYSTLYWIEDNHLTPIEVMLEDDGKSWWLPDSIIAYERYFAVARPDLEPYEVGLVKNPAWSPDGNSIAFWATLEPLGQRFNTFETYEWDLYLMNPTTLEVERLLDDTYEPELLAWSPDGQWLAFISGVRSKRELRMFSPATGQTVLIKRGTFGDLAWSPDGQTLVVLQCSDTSCETTEAYLYDVSNVGSE